MPHWFDTILVFITIGGALSYFVVRGIRHWRTPNSGCSGGCCTVAKKRNDLEKGHSHSR